MTDERIPEATLRELDKIILERSTKDSLYSLASFIRQVKKGKYQVVIERYVTFKEDSTAKIKYYFSNILIPEYDIGDSSTRVTKTFETTMTKRPVYYCTPHNGEQHKADRYEDIPKVRQTHGCGKDWTMEWIDR